MAPLPVNLCKVDVYASSVIDSSLSESWQHARDFGQASWWLSAGNGEFAVQRLGPRAVAEIGCERVFSVGRARLFETLTALDDMEHILRWVLVSHQDTVSPFGQASFVNYMSSIQLRAVTMTNQTFAEWRGQFFTEPQYAAQMESILQSWYFAGFKGLEVCASGLEALDVQSPHTMPYTPSSVNAKYSVPVQPPPNEQAAFQSPLEVQHMEPPPSMSQTQGTMTSDRLASSAGMATSSSHAWQAARAAFAGAPPSLPSRNSNPKSAASPSRVVPVPQGPASNASSNGTQFRMGGAKRPAEVEPPMPMPQNGHEGPPIGTMNATGMGGNLYHPHLGSIQEGSQMAPAQPDVYAQTQGGVPADTLDRSTSNMSLGHYSKCSSMSSNHSNGSSRAILRDQLNTKDSISLDGAGDKRQSRGFTSSRRSWQEQDPRPSQRPPSASAMKEEAMQKLNIGAGQRPGDRRNNMRKNIRPDWANMKEVAYVDSEHDAELMAGVADNMGKHHKQYTERTSLEETVAKLQERHKMLHAERKSTEQPFVSPFSANPFAAAQPVLSDS